MEELYWITRLDSIHTLFEALLIVFSLLGTIVIVFGLVAYVEDASEEVKKLIIKLCRAFLFIVLFSATGLVFTPTTKEALLIYGVGGTIDYIQQNETAKHLPDKCVKALDLFIDDYIEEEELEK